MPYVSSECKEGYVYVDYLDHSRRLPYDFKAKHPHRQLQVPDRRRCRSHSPAPRTSQQHDDVRLQPECEQQRVRNGSKGGLFDQLLTALLSVSPRRRRHSDQCVSLPENPEVRYESLEVRTRSGMQLRRTDFLVQTQEEIFKPCTMPLVQYQPNSSAEASLACRTATAARSNVQNKLGSRGTGDYTLVGYLRDRTDRDLFYLEVQIGPNQFTYFTASLAAAPNVLVTGPAESRIKLCSLQPN